MYTDYIAQSDHQQHEHELAQRLERRRVAAERAVADLPGGRLELIARFAREARIKRASSPVGGRATPAAG
jgi:hypothetical protein